MYEVQTKGTSRYETRTKHRTYFAASKALDRAIVAAGENGRIIGTGTHGESTWTGYDTPPKPTGKPHITRTRTVEQAETREELRAILANNRTVYTVLRHVSGSGMYRAIDVYVMGKNGPRRISWLIARALDMKYDDRYEALGVSGAGMDMGFHIVNSLSASLYGHANDGGYRLSHRWM